MIRTRRLLRVLPQFLGWLVIFIGCFLMLLPFLWMVLCSVMTTAQIQSYPPRFIPSPPTMEHFGKILSIGYEPNLWFRMSVYYKNSLVIAAISVSLSIFFGLFAGYAFSIYEFPLKTFFFILILSTVMVPFQLTMVSLYIMLAKFKAIDTMFAILTPNLASATGVFLITQGIKTVPLSLIDSARMDGAGEARIVLSIVAPTVKTTLVTAALILFLGSWNDFLWPVIVINSERLRTIPVALAFFRDPHGNTDMGQMMAATVIAIIPLLTVYVFTQKYVIRGIALTGLKS